MKVNVAFGTLCPYIEEYVAQHLGKTPFWVAGKREVDVLIVLGAVVLGEFSVGWQVHQRDDADRSAHRLRIKQRLQANCRLHAGYFVHMHSGRHTQARARLSTANFAEWPSVLAERWILEMNMAAKNAGLSEGAG